MDDEAFELEIVADTAAFEQSLGRLEKLADGFGHSLTSALRSAAVSGKSLDDVLRRLGLNLAGLALEQGLQPLRQLTGSLFTTLFSGPRALPFAKGGVVPFAEGGVVAAPTYFPLGGRVGLMGEAGAEAILPLARGADGRLGVASQGGGAPVSITFNVTTPDAASFRKSEAQITGMIARAATRGMRSI